MFKVVHKQVLVQDIKRLDFHAPAIAAQALPGQFVMLTPDGAHHAIPLTIADADERKGNISLIVHEVGASTRAMGSLGIGDAPQSIVGPLGQPALVEKYGLVAAVATGIGAAQILPLCRALKKKGNKVIGIVGAKSKKVLMLEAQMRVVCDEIFITTNDGSYERKGLATQVLGEILNKSNVHCVYAAGGVDMMRASVAMAAAKNIPVHVTLSPFMATGMGTCGSCRVRVGDEFKLACVDGPHFDGHQVDFDDLEKRMNALKEDGWQLPRPSSPRTGGLTTFVKSLWVSPKNKM